MSDHDLIAEAEAQQIEAALLQLLCPTHCGYRISSGGMTVDSAGKMTSHHTQGGPCGIHVGMARALRSAIMPIVADRLSRVTADNEALRGLPTTEQCADCGGNIPAPWFVENPLWNAVMNTDALHALIICARCFMVRAEERFAAPIWKLVLDQTTGSGPSVDSQLATAHHDNEALQAQLDQVRALRDVLLYEAGVVESHPPRTRIDDPVMRAWIRRNIAADLTAIVGPALPDTQNAAKEQER